MESEKVGIIGYGVVGKAVNYTMKNAYEIIKYDKYGDYDKLEDTLISDFIFITVPTPFDYKKNIVDLSAVNDSLSFLNNENYKGIVIIKSTLPIGSCDIFIKEYGLNLVYNPEFLRESKTPFEDFENQVDVVIGTSNENSFFLVKSLYESVLANSTNYHKVSFKEGEMIKYSQNATLASRVAISNVIFDACQYYELDYNVIRKLAFDECDLLGPNMVEVPGPDGKRGFGGKCLPKDIRAFSTVYESDLLKEIISYNDSLRDDLGKFLINYKK